MEFKDLATKFEGLTADQVGVLAEFGKNILDDISIEFEKGKTTRILFALLLAEFNSGYTQNRRVRF